MEKQFLDTFPQDAANTLIYLALQEDLGATGDITTRATIESSDQCLASLKAKSSGIFAGKPIPQLVFKSYGATEVHLQWSVQEGQYIQPGQILGTFKGPTQIILECERVILNFLQRMSGIASKTHQFKSALAGFSTKILDTRKTLPGFRDLDKYSVRVGGGKNHRMGLFDQVLIKDNHIEACGTVKNALEKCVATYQKKYVIEAEVKSLEELRSIVPGKANWILLDNMNLDEIKECVSYARNTQPSLLLEASGNMDLKKITELAPLGLDFISVGQLTHSVEAMDISLLIERIV